MRNVSCKQNDNEKSYTDNGELQEHFLNCWQFLCDKRCIGLRKAMRMIRPKKARE